MKLTQTQAIMMKPLVEDLVAKVVDGARQELKAELLPGAAEVALEILEGVVEAYELRLKTEREYWISRGSK